MCVYMGRNDIVECRLSFFFQILPFFYDTTFSTTLHNGHDQGNILSNSFFFWYNLNFQFRKHALFFIRVFVRGMHLWFVKTKTPKFVYRVFFSSFKEFVGRGKSKLWKVNLKQWLKWNEMREEKIDRWTEISIFFVFVRTDPSKVEKCQMWLRLCHFRVTFIIVLVSVFSLKEIIKN